MERITTANSTFAKRYVSLKSMLFGIEKIFIFPLLFIVSCNSNEEKLTIIMESENLKIQVNSYGGLGGYSTSEYQIIRNESERYLLKNVEKEYESRINFPIEKDSLLNEFLNSCLKSDDPEREHKSGCIGPTDRVYEFSSGGTKLILSPNADAHELFDELIRE